MCGPHLVRYFSNAALSTWLYTGHVILPSHQMSLHSVHQHAPSPCSSWLDGWNENVYAYPLRTLSQFCPVCLQIDHLSSSILKVDGDSPTRLSSVYSWIPTLLRKPQSHNIQTFFYIFFSCLIVNTQCTADFVNSISLLSLLLQVYTVLHYLANGLINIFCNSEMRCWTLFYQHISFKFICLPSVFHISPPTWTRDATVGPIHCASTSSTQHRSLEESTVASLLQRFLVFHRTGRSVAVSTRIWALDQFSSQANPVHILTSQFINIKFNTILPFIQISREHSSFQIKILYVFLTPPMSDTFSTCIIIFDLIILIIYEYEGGNILWISSQCNLSNS